MTSVGLGRMFLIAATTMFAAIADESPNFFNKNPGQIQILINDDGVRALRVNSRKNVPAEVVAFGKKWRRVPMHLKGSGTFQSIDEKPSLTLEFGDSKIHLNNSADDPSRLNEFIGTHIFSAAGMTVPKVTHGVLTLNGKRLGLYVVKEGFDLPSVELPDTNFTSWNQLERAVDMDSFCAFMALEVMICHWDGYSLRANNFHLSKGPGTARFVFQPAGMDQLFGKPDFNWKPDMTGPLARAVMSFPEGRTLYEKEFRKLFEAVFDPKKLRALVEHRVEEIRPVLVKSEIEDLRHEADNLCERITQRHNYLQKELVRSEKTQIPSLRGQRNAGL
jgi:spore coat protein H